MLQRIDCDMDIFYGRKKQILAAGMAATACCCLMVAFPTIALYSARKGISLWLRDVLPALLPFFICANFLQNIGVIRFLRSGVFPFAMSVLSGYPMGAKIIGDLKRGGEISLGEAKRLLSFCSTSGPAFMIGAVGAGMLGSGLMGAVIAGAHYAGALCNGLIYSRILGREDRESGIDPVCGNRSMQESFTEAILASFRSLGIVLAYIVLFMFLTDLLHMCGVFSIVESPALRALMKGFFEMTVGCGAVAECHQITAQLQCVLCTAVLSWGGISVMGQSMSMVSGCGITMRFLVLSKLTHCLFSAIFAFLAATLVL